MLSVPLFSIKDPHPLNAVHPLPHVHSIISTLLLLAAVVLTGSIGFSQSPSTARLNLRISAVTWPVFLAPYIVRTFQEPMFKVFLVERRVIGNVASFRLSPQHVIRSGKPGPASSSIIFICCACFCSVVFFTRWGCWPHVRPSSFLRPGLAELF